MKLLDFTTGKKTYIAVAVGVALGVAQGLGYHIPDWVMWIAGFSGLAAHRAALQSQTSIATSQAEAVIKAILSEIEVPEVASATPEVPASAKIIPVTISALPPVS